MTVSIDLSTTRLAQVRHELGRVIVGQDRVVDRLLVAVLADGHVLLEGAPGLGKTLLLATLARILGGSFNRIQFTPRPDPVRHRRDPDLPALVRGVRRRARADPGQHRPGRRDQPRPRARPVGAARGDGGAAGHGRRSHLRDAAAVPGRGHPEPRRVGGRLSARRGAARSVPDAGPGRLPDPDRGARDRRPHGRPATPGGPPARCGRRGRPSDRGPAESRSTRQRSTTRSAWCSRPATRRRTDLPKLVGLLEYGASPRASLGLVRSARAMALLRGRERAVPQDVYDVAYDILNARLALSYRALAEGFTIDDVLVELLTTVPAPGSACVAAGDGDRRLAPAYPADTRPLSASPTEPMLAVGGTPPIVLPGDQPARQVTCRSRSAGLDLPARLRRIELAVSHKVFGRRDGRHPSLVLGHGVEPGDARPYEPGDDVRRMDWSILARTGEPHVRDAIQERDLDVAVLVDRSGSLDFGTVGWRKADLAVSVASAVSGARRPRRRPDRRGRRDRRRATDRADPRRSTASDGPRGQRRTVTARGRGRSRSRHRRSPTRPATRWTRDRGLGLHRSHRHLEPGARAARHVEARSSPSRSSTRASSDCPMSACW